MTDQRFTMTIGDINKQQFTKRTDENGKLEGPAWSKRTNNTLDVPRNTQKSDFCIQKSDFVYKKSSICTNMANAPNIDCREYLLF
jgi:hypothetical protein